MNDTQSVVEPYFSKSDINRLGDRLKLVPIAEADLVLLNNYRNSFYDTAAFVQAEVFCITSLSASSRPSKTNESIISKLKRLKSTRLSQIQDIAGIRLVVENITEQNKIRDLIVANFSGCKVVDRREDPSYGYRAVHIIVNVDNKLVEIQIRTKLQHLWAQLSEASSEVTESNLKYGQGDPSTLEDLLLRSNAIKLLEESSFSSTNPLIDSIFVGLKLILGMVIVTSIEDKKNDILNPLPPLQK